MPSSALRVIADQESLQLFFAIATKNGIGSKDLRRLRSLTKKEYYPRTSLMLETGANQENQSILHADGVRTGDVPGLSSNRRSSSTLFSVKGNRRY